MSEFLFEEFKPVSAKAWKQKIQYDLKGEDYNEKLVWQSPEGIHVKPFYHQDDFSEPFQPVPGQPESWRILQEVFIDDPGKANRIAIHAVERGAEGIIFKAEKEFEIQTVFKDFPFEKIPVYLDFNFLDGRFYKEIIQFLKKEQALFYISLDSIGKLARTGNWFKNKQEDFKTLQEIVSHYPENNLLAVDMSLYQNAGATIVQQLVYGLAHANEYLNYFIENQKIQTPFPLLFRVSVGSNYFFEIAKLRALRKLYAILAEEYNLKTTCHILAVPSRRNKTLYDYNVNMLRTTTESMSAVLGGADAVCNLAYDAVFHKSNEFGERMARNQLLILKEESYFDAVKNPVDGTYYIESLTESLIDDSLVLFKDIEKNGGFLNQLKKGIIQKKIRENAEREQDKFDSGELKLLGTNYHPNPRDRMKDDLELYPFLKHNPVKTHIEPILEKRLAENEEQKRLQEEESGNSTKL